MSIRSFVIRRSGRPGSDEVSLALTRAGLDELTQLVPRLARAVCMTFKIRNRRWPWFGGLLLAACSAGSGKDASSAPIKTCARTQCDVQYEQCPKPRSLCDQCWDTCDGIDPNLAIACIKTCADVCAHDSDTSSPCALARARCRLTPQEKVCLEGSQETGEAGAPGAGIASGPSSSGAPGGAGIASGPSSSGAASLAGATSSPTSSGGGGSSGRGSGPSAHAGETGSGGQAR